MRRHPRTIPPRNADSPTATARLLAALLVAPWCLRLALINSMPSGSFALAARGFLADLMVAFALWPCLIATRRVGRASRTRAAIGMIVVVLWGLFHAVNYEHVRVHGALADRANAGFLVDPVFLGGSAHAILQPLILTLLGVSALLVILGARPRVVSPTADVALIALVGVTLALWPVHPRYAAWPQRNFILANTATAMRDWISGTDPHRPSEPSTTVHSSADLNGTPRVPLGHAGHNVLLIMLEGLSGGHLPSVAGHDQAPASMHLLDQRVAHDFVVFRRFVAQQRQTSRGQYALLCGEPPAFNGARPRMAAVATRDFRATGNIADTSNTVAPCLPHALATRGYQTRYLQAAPLAFQRKDQFMPRAGFAHAAGADAFGPEVERTPWGVDDGALFRRALDVITELEQDGAPWFLTLLTVGTHHPFHVPGAPAEPDTPRAFARAVRYLDQTLDHFLDQLDASGLADDTLIVITSDESSGLGMARQVDDNRADEALRQAWGLLAVRTPGVSAFVDEPFAQSDVALSVLDYLGQPIDALPFDGRSLFRTYATPRPIPFGNVYQRTVGAFFDDDTFYLCDRDAANCTGHALDGGFGGVTPGLVDPRPSRIAWIRDAANAPSRLGTATSSVAPRWWSPLFEHRTLRESNANDAPASLHGTFHFAARSHVTIALDATFTGTVATAFHHQVQVSGGPTHILDIPALVHGDRVTLRARLITGPTAVPGVVIRLSAGSPMADGALTLREGSVHLEPIADAERTHADERGLAVVIERAVIERNGVPIDWAPQWRIDGNRSGRDQG